MRYADQCVCYARHAGTLRQAASGSQREQSHAGLPGIVTVTQPARSAWCPACT